MTIALQVATLAVLLYAVRPRRRTLTRLRDRMSAAARRTLRGVECVYCGARATVLDHIRPTSRGGADHPDNLVGACVDCNAAKGNRLLDEWIPERVLRAVQVSPKVYRELVALGRDRAAVGREYRPLLPLVDSRQVEALPRPARPPGGPFYTLAEAAREPWCPLGPDALRQAKSRGRRAGTWPRGAVVDGVERYTRAELVAALANRPRGVDQVDPVDGAGVAA